MWSRSNKSTCWERVRQCGNRPFESFHERRALLYYYSPYWLLRHWNEISLSFLVNPSRFLSTKQCTKLRNVWNDNCLHTRSCKHFVAHRLASNPHFLPEEDVEKLPTPFHGCSRIASSVHRCIAADIQTTGGCCGSFWPEGLGSVGHVRCRGWWVMEGWEMFCCKMALATHDRYGLKVPLVKGLLR